jgi:hypothetical protein
MSYAKSGTTKATQITKMHIKETSKSNQLPQILKNAVPCKIPFHKTSIKIIELTIHSKVINQSSSGNDPKYIRLHPMHMIESTIRIM